MIDAVNSDLDRTSLQDIARVFDPSRLIQARQLSRLTKADLHRAVGVSAAAIGQYERGEATPRVDTLISLAKALNVPPDFFALGRPRARLEVAQASFRRLRATSVAQQQQAVSYAEQVWELSSHLEQSVEFPELNLPQWAMTDEHEMAARPDPITAARLVRNHWGLGIEPIKFLVYELEQHGILTVFFSMKEDKNSDEKSRIDAFSTSSLPRPVIVLTPDKADDVMRHRFSAAHELGHIVLHRWRPGSNTELEREADAFAAEFLTPRDVIRTQLPTRFSLGKLEELSLQWGASIKSLVFRSKELELISEATARRAYVTLNTLTANGTIRPQPVENFPGEQPELLKNALEALDEAGIPISQIARELHVTPKHVCRLAGIKDTRPKLRLVR